MSNCVGFIKSITKLKVANALTWGGTLGASLGLLATVIGLIARQSAEDIFEFSNPKDISTIKELCQIAIAAENMNKED